MGLDALTLDERQQLFRAALNRKTIVAHNVGVALSWLFAETSARPSFVLDSMLLMRQLRPESLLRPFGIVVAGGSDDQLRAQTLIERARGVPSASLEWIATSLGLPVPDEGYHQQHEFNQ